MFVFIIGIILSSVYFVLFSQSGLLERINLEEENKLAYGKIEKLNSEKKNLQNTLRGYQRGHYSDRDMLESGYIKPGEKIIYFKGQREKTQSKEFEKTSDAGYFLKLTHLRMIWITFSAAVLLVLLIYGRKKREFDVYRDDQ